jgi:hypothetical protein
MCVQGKGAGTPELLAAVEKLTDLAVRMDFSGIRKELRGLVPEFFQGSETDPRSAQPSWDPWEVLDAPALDSRHEAGTARSARPDALRGVQSVPLQG